MLSIINYMNQSSSEKSNTVKDGRAVSSFLNDNQLPKLFIKKKILLKIDQMISHPVIIPLIAPMFQFTVSSERSKDVSEAGKPIPQRRKPSSAVDKQNTISR